MSMLAEPRRKQKVINLRAKNSAWSNDSSKFGQRMLEKMGWSAGKGLGANENGIVEHVVARYKNDEKGLGFEDKNDQWTKHEDDFNALLANLSNGDKSEKKLHSGISLEVKSKSSKARVHYHKFTRGKDLTRYSEKDLANIFGKKSLKDEGKEEELIKDDLKTTEQIFTEKGSMEDYFKSKLEKFKSKLKMMPIDDISDEVGADYAFQGFSVNSNNETSEVQSFSFYNTQNEVKQSLSEHNSQPCDSESIPKKKKKKKSKDTEQIENDITENISSKSKKKKKMNIAYSEGNDCIEAIQAICKNEKKMKKKTKLIDNEVPNEILEENVAKKKKFKNKSAPPVDEPQEVAEINAYVPKKKKKRKDIEGEN